MQWLLSRMKILWFKQFTKISIRMAAFIVFRQIQPSLIGEHFFHIVCIEIEISTKVYISGTCRNLTDLIDFSAPNNN